MGRDGQLAQTIEHEWPTVAELLQRKMRNGTYHFTSYREVLLSKGAHSPPRVVSVPTARDRIVLKTLAAVILNVFPEAKTRMPQARVTELVSALAQSGFDSFVRIDVKNFYPSISHRAILERLRSRIRQPAILSLIVRAISTPTVPLRAAKPSFSTIRGVPQGLPISNPLAEIAMADIDAEYAATDGVIYFRYVDDILLLCQRSDAFELYKRIQQRCADVGLEVHGLHEGSKSMIGSLSDSFEYLGYEFSPNRITVRRPSVQKLEATIVRLFTAYKYQKNNSSAKDWRDKTIKSLTQRLNLVVAGCVYESVPRGWIHYFSQMDDMVLLSRLDAYVSRLSLRFELPPTFKPKSFVRAYWHVVKPDARSGEYIPNFDRFTYIDQRAFLASLFPGQQFAMLSPLEIETRFRAEVRHLVSLLERDISQTS